ncbi:MAG: tRNA (adenosine(37)-N6)-threonylcarbamoyltransferase complex ATPase subunit type 1 TsaE [Planctomycetota bacterium]|jgi:tRNA threonylcarbamoyladenosine biosynthesis protein TsaE|nr:tRNA (adenosine(37)-N6)-threonylcarbamoyltransferase complex ATPase subunit type 1 TsaE [Planctomycetota bacterium]
MVREGNPAVDEPARDGMAAVSLSPNDTRALARRLGGLCRGGEIILLRGDLGAGKTCFVQGLAAGLETPPNLPVTSPTFVLHAEYQGRLRLNHLDLYRLDDPCALDGLGVWDILADKGAVAAVEWPELLAGPNLGGCLDVGIQIAGETRRELRVSARGAGHAGLLAAWLGQPIP